ncbi:precorrin-6Y C5,15-methyltransferase (decarboxylating) [Desulforamulus reducens MI-1]|uniref:Precorrin-6Y C5,15-methyltransferase (Decarboxylating) n=1 Tax=Desulforamulus reducens (strain ATCC BAA-1160 / DSM 100696 / MI-1) TaxID=349161 RepID=A4J814_DESRM|nr:precorrin-6y C5,15-methyltransferase (decarboxylating) subunit CbiE [Desulforamulus reducens]ABO51217.1 precorrin-6Y C5,15-methyltransferase (decarboxylating) [Desulforamulus reducens MI-1]
MENIIKVVGVGPGGPEYLTAAGAAALEQAEVVVGGRRLLAQFARPEQRSYALTADLEATIDFIRQEYKNNRVVVLVSGDTGLYSFAATLMEKLPKDCLEFIPGISSVQLMFARLKTPWQDAAVISRHGRDDSRLVGIVKAGIMVAILTDAKNNPQALARELLESACPNLPVSVGCNLSYANETIFRGTLRSLAESNQKFENCVVVIGV